MIDMLSKSLVIPVLYSYQFDNGKSENKLEQILPVIK